MKWKISTDQKKIGDFICQKAELQDTAKTVIAWFTPQIPISSGPGEYNNLPGLVLEVDIDNGKEIILAESVSFKDIEDKELKEPTKGKEVTREEYKEIVAEKMKEMEESGGMTRQIHVIKN